MSLTAAAIRAMAGKGMSAQDIADIAEAMEAPLQLLSPGALRTRKYREKKAVTDASPNVTVTDASEVESVTERHQTSQAELAPIRAQVVTPSLPSLRSEELTPTSEPSVPSLPPSRKARPSDFDLFWKIYPRKVAKDHARKAFAKAFAKIKHPHPLEILLAGAERVATEAAERGDMNFIKHPATWLNGGCWDDEPVSETQNGSGPQPRTRWSLDRERKTSAYQQGLVDFVNGGGRRE